jgi:Predicted oxidoreductases (related to aryl-alcohol dehydrogenases)
MELNIKQLNQTIKPLGMGCWAIGGTWGPKDLPLGWSTVDDQESIKALRHAYEMGITLFDTAATYGYGHSEKVVGEAFHDIRDKILLATKFGCPFDEVKKEGRGVSIERESIITECHDSLRRLRTDYIDIYQLHIQEVELNQIDDVVETLELLKERGDIRSYGWSTDSPKKAEAILKYPACSAIQFDLNIFTDNGEMIQLIDEHQAMGLNRQPLAMGLLSGKYNANSKLPKDDIRSGSLDWMIYFDQGVPNSTLLNKLEAIREIITSGGRTMVQGALAWNWAKSPFMVPIPGFKNIKQVEDNVRALEFGPLTKKQVEEVNQIIKA